MTDKQKLWLSEFARHGGLLVPNDDAGKAICADLTAMKYLRPQCFIEGNKPVGQAAVGVGYQITAKGRKAAESLKPAKAL